MDAVSGLLTAFGISAPAGLNAYLTLLMVGLLARFTDLLKLREPFDLLTNDWVLGALLVLTLLELFVDKIPGLDTINDVLGTVIRPAAGAIIFAADTNVISDLNPVFGAILGLVAAGSLHLAKAGARPPVQMMTGGVGGAVVSSFEDMVVVLTIIFAVVAPIVGLVILLLSIWLFRRWYRGRKARAARQQGPPAAPTAAAP